MPGKTNLPPAVDLIRKSPATKRDVFHIAATSGTGTNATACGLTLDGDLTVEADLDANVESLRGVRVCGNCRRESAKSIAAAAETPADETPQAPFLDAEDADDADGRLLVVPVAPPATNGARKELAADLATRVEAAFPGRDDHLALTRYGVRLALWRAGERSRPSDFKRHGLTKDDVATLDALVAPQEAS